MKHQQVIPDYAAMVQTSGTMLCLVFSGWVLFRLVQAVFWLPGYLEKTGGSLYQKMEPKTPLAPQKAASSSSKKRSPKAKDSDDETEDVIGDDDDAIVSSDAGTTAEEEKGKEDAVEQEKVDEEEGEDELPAGSKKEN